MTTNITVTITGLETPTELNALAALIAVLGGRVGNTVRALHDELHDPVMPEVRAALATPGEDEVITPAPLAGADQSAGSNGPAPTAPPAPPSAQREVDARGIPFDERIHTSGENKRNADNTWRKRRGVTDAVIAQVEAELLGGQAAPTPAAPDAPPAPTPAPPVPAAPAPVADPNAGAAPAAPTAPPAPVVAPAADAAPTPTVPRSERFESMAAFATYVAGKGSTYLALGEKAKEFGKDSFADVTKDPSVWDAFCLSFGWVD